MFLFYIFFLGGGSLFSSFWVLGVFVFKTLVCRPMNNEGLVIESTVDYGLVLL